MSRIGRKPIPVPDGVLISIEPELVRVSGPRGELTERVSRDIDVTQNDGELVVTRPTDRAEHRALHGLTRSLVANMGEGVTAGFEKRPQVPGGRLREAPRDPGRRLPRGAQGPRPRARARLLARGPDQGAGRHRVRGPAADPHRREGPLEAAGRRDRREHPQEAPAGALQGQGHPLRGRVRGPEGRQARMTVVTRPQARLKRRRRVRAKITGTPQRPRISIFRSNRGIHAQLVDDLAGATLAAVSWTESDLRSLKPMEQAEKAGQLLAERAKAAGVESAVFDRGGYRYHGRVKAFADGVREGGLTV